MSAAEPFVIRAMTRAETSFAIDLAAQEGWNPGLHDALCFYEADPKGFLIGELNGEPIGCISAVSYAGRFGFIGLYIVRPEFRGRGFGIQLWRAAMERLRGHNVGLDGVLAQQANYTKSGFTLAYRNIRFAAPTRFASDSRSPEANESIRPASAVPFGSLLALDRRLFPEPRETFLKHWLAQPEVGAFAARRGERLTGFTVVRRCRVGWKIGPLAAEDRATAEALYRAASDHAHCLAPGEIFLDVPEPNTAAMQLAEAHGMRVVFETARMYTQAAPNVSLAETFGITTFELG